MAALVCHPHPLFGGTMHNKVVYRMARGLRRAGVVVLRFNFRGVGRSQGEHAHLEGEIEDARAALDVAARALSGTAVRAGRFFVRLARDHAAGLFDWTARLPDGCRISDAHGPAGLSGKLRAPKIFIQSTNDQYGPRAELEAALRAFAEPKKLIWIESSDHFFAGGLEELEEKVKLAADERR